MFPPIAAPPTTGLIELVEQKHIEQLDPNSTRRALFNKHSPTCLPIGSVLEVETWDDFPTNTTFTAFSGHMIAIHRRGIDTSFRLRTVIGRIGVEQVFKLFAPNIKTLRVLHRGAVRGKKYRKAKLYFTREPGTRSTLGGVEGVARLAKQLEREAREEKERDLKKKGIIIPEVEKPVVKKEEKKKK